MIFCGLACCTSLDGISGGSDLPDAATNDAAISNETGTTEDSAVETGANADASVDAGSPCSAQHTFCDDFDRDGGVSAPWTGITNPTGTMTIVNETSVSAPSSLLVNLESDAGTAFLHRDVGVANTSIHFEADLNLAQTTSGAEVDLVQIKWLTPPAPCTNLGYYIVRDRTGPMVLQETYTGCGSNVNPSLGNPAGWNHFTLDITLGVTGHIKLKIGDVTFVDKDVRELPAAPIELRLGAGGEALKGAWRVRYDNVLVDLK